jgi:hypothetical protein
MIDKYGHEWVDERFNGHIVDGLAKSLVMFLQGSPVEAVREQSLLEQPIGGWTHAFRRLVDELQLTCPPGFRVGYAPFEKQQRHILTYLEIQ